jgi:hypothetical protein
VLPVAIVPKLCVTDENVMPPPPADVTVTLVVPDDAPYTPLTPAYAAVMEFDPIAIALPAAVIEHVPLASVQLPNDALFVVSVNATVPVGVFAPFVVSVTVALSMVDAVDAIVVGFADAAVEVASAPTVTIVVPDDGA